MTIVFEGPAGVATYQAITLKHALKLYAKTGMKPNRAYTPSAMLATAGRITGKTYKRGQYQEAIADLTAWINVNGTSGKEGPQHDAHVDAWAKHKLNNFFGL